MRRAWHRQQGEPEAAWAAFGVYQRLRDLQDVLQQLGRKPGYMRNLEFWEGRWDWEARAAARDAWERERMARDHAREARALRGKMTVALAKTDPADLTPRDKIALLSLAAAQERDSLGGYPPPREPPTTAAPGRDTAREPINIQDFFTRKRVG